MPAHVPTSLDKTMSSRPVGDPVTKSKIDSNKGRDLNILLDSVCVLTSVYRHTLTHTGGGIYCIKKEGGREGRKKRGRQAALRDSGLRGAGWRALEGAALTP